MQENPRENKSRERQGKEDTVFCENIFFTILLRGYSGFKHSDYLHCILNTFYYSLLYNLNYY